MAGSTTVSVAVALACLVVVVLCTIPALVQLIQRLRKHKDQYRELSSRYEDKDGVATEASQAAYSDLVQRLILVLLSTVAVLDTLAFAVYITTGPVALLRLEQWFQFGTWILILAQAVVIYITSSSTEKYDLGMYTSGSALAIVIGVAVENLSLRQQEAVNLPREIHLTFSLIQWVSAVIILFTSLSIPRRPDVYRHDLVVDRQHTTSVLGKFTFSWPTSVLLFAIRNRGLDYDDLPEISYENRARTLRDRFEAVGKKDKLWKSIFWAHKYAFIQQWVLQAICSITNFLPQIALYFILRVLEDRDQGIDVGMQAWLLVIVLGLSVTISSWIEAYMFFVAFMRVGVPIYEQLSAVIFDKAIRRKDVKGVTKAPEADQQIGDGDIVVNQEAGPKGEDTVPEDDEEDTAKTRQSTINLVGIDSKRISDFAMFNYIFLGSTIKFIFAVGFLVNLIGWIPMLAGFIAPAIITPLNVYISRKYAAAQDDLMKYRDQKMAVVTEALQGIRQIKFSALEREWCEKVLQTRRKELNTQWRVFCYDASLISIWIFGPVMLSAISLTVYAIIHKELTASVAFTTISVFEAIEMTLAIIPEMVTDLLDSLISAGRIQAYLDSAELEDDTIPGEQVKFSNASISWPSDDPEKEEDLFHLRNLDLDFPKGELSVISGRTGSGKSLLLSSIIGEAEVRAGTVAVPTPPPATQRFDPKATKQDWIIPSSLAFVAQIPWIENATIRDNILFGLPLDDERYKQVLHDCALEKDLEMLEDGEMTDIGANGINLSGGQKWRVSFARALYSRAGILVLDDIFSAVDANVGRHLYEKALTGALGKGRTRILVTHHVALCLPRTTYSVLLADGTVDTAGRTAELRKNGQLKRILDQDVEEQRKDEEEALKQEAAVDDGGGLQKMLTNRSKRSRRESALSAHSPPDLTRRRSHATLENGNATGNSKKDPPKKFTEEEGRETGTIRWEVYARYIRACGGYSWWALIMFAFGFWILVYLARSYWISVWTRSYHTESGDSTLGVKLVQQTGHYLHHYKNRLSTTELDSDLAYYLGVYLGISLMAWLVGTVRYFVVMVASIRASKVLFETLTYAVLRAPLRWLDTVPLGRILNRFTSDFNMIDSRIAYDISFMLHNGMQVLAVIIAGVVVSPFMILFALVLLGVCMFYALRYLAGAREVKRLESNAKSPVFEQFGSVLTGIATIRAFDKTDAYIERMFKRIDTHCRAYWHLWLFNRWMGFRLNMVGAVFAAIVAALIVSIRGIDASLAGFALSFALNLSEAVIWMLRQYSNVELDSNATERIVEYSNIALENQGGESAPAAWPARGEVEVNDLVVSYASDLPPVLKGLTFSVTQNQRIGVVGRTGAGKSSLTLALFRFLEARAGSIHIDGIDISKIKLSDLRSRLAIIPQDPVLFSGTVRSNLDPFQQHTDVELRDALARVHLIPSAASVAPSGTQTPTAATGSASPVIASDTSTNKNIFRSLNSKISEGGLNLSQGQRQLLCLARAIVSRPKIMVLDEATSAVDVETDALIQRSIREEFGDATLIVIAHRLSTIADFDRILVMGEGRVVEFGSPRELMGMGEGVFRGLVGESGERGQLEGIIFGGGGAAEG